MDTTKAPLNEPEDETKKIEYARIIANGPPTIPLWQFIDYLLPQTNGTSLPAFYRLVQEFELVVYNGVLGKKNNWHCNVMAHTPAIISSHTRYKYQANKKPPQIVPSYELLESLRKREQQGRHSLKSFQFWETLPIESKYCIWRNDVEAAYGRAGETKFPWLSWHDEKVELDLKKQLFKENNNDFDKRLAVLKTWLSKQDFYSGDVITTLPRGFTYNKIHTALNNESSDKSLFDLTLESFKRHFWQKQKIAKLKSGR